MDREIDYRALERNLRANPAAVEPGEACAECSKFIPKDYMINKKIFHPAGRPHGTV